MHRSLLEHFFGLSPRALRKQRRKQRLASRRSSRRRFGLERLEDRLVLATLDITGGALTYTGADVDNTLTVSLAGGTLTFNDPLDPITVTADAAAQLAGWTPGGPAANASGGVSAVTSVININLGTMSDTLNLGTFDAALPSNVSVTITGGGQAGDTATVAAGGVGLETAGTGAISATGFDTITVNQGVTALGSGAVDLEAARSVVVSGTGSVTTDSGALTLSGNSAGTTSGNFAGININGGTVTSATGAISVMGHGGDTSLENHGVFLQNGGQIESTTGTVTVAGTGGDGTDFNDGIAINGSGSAILSQDGNMSVTGTGGNGSGANNRGVDLEGGGKIQSTGTATVTVEGTGGNGTTFNDGILILSSGSAILSQDGNMSVTGTGGNGSGADNEGIILQGGGQIQATGTANISVHGDGVLGPGVNISSGTVSSGTGTVDVISEDDVLFGATGLIQSTAGTVTVTADNAAGNNGGGISMADGSRIDGGSGAVNLNADGNILLGGVSTTGAVAIQTTSGSILDNGDTDVDLAALSAVLTAGGAIGQAAGNGAIDTAVSSLQAQASGGGVWIDNTGGLTVVGVSATGTVEVSAASPIDVTGNVTGAGPVTLTAGDTAAPNDNLTVHNGVTVSSSTSDVTLRAGDNLSLQNGSTVSAPAGQVALLGDYGDADPGIGSTMDLLGTIISSSQATATGGADNDTINVNPGPGDSIDSIQLDGAGGDDTYFVQYGALNGGASAVIIADSGVGGNDQATISGTAAAEDFSVLNNGIPMTGGTVADNTLGETVSYSQTLENLTVQGQDFPDTFHVAPSQTALINIDGGDPPPPASPGDQLDFMTPAGQTATSTPNTPAPGQTTIATTGGFANVVYQHIETVALGGAVVFNGTSDDDTLTINATGTDSGTYQLTQNGVVIDSGVLAGVTSLTFNGLGGDDQLIINNPGGGLFNPVDGINYDGGTGGEGTPGNNPTGDELEILGGTAGSVRHQFTNNNDGFVYYNGAGSPSITYTGLEPITDTVTATNRTFTFTGGAETVTLSDDGGPGNGQSEVDSSLGESVVFANPSGTLTLDTTAGGGPDAINLEGLDSLFNANLTVTAKGNDTVTSQTNPTDIGAGNLNVTAGSIALNANVTTTGNANLTALTGSITDNADDNAANLVANNVHLTLSAGGNTIGSSTADRFELDAATLQVTANSGGNAYLRDTAGGVALVDSSVTGAGTYDLEALNGNITSNVVDGTRDVGAGILVLTTTGGGSIGTGPADRLEINATTRFDATTAGGSVFVLDPNGSLPVGTISAPGATVNLLSTGGPISDANGGSTNVTSSNLIASATTGIDLDTDVDTITATTTGTGAISLREASGVTLNNVTSNDGNVTITAGGTTNAVSVTAGGSGNVSITTSAGDINLTSVTAAGDRVTLDAAGSILDASGAVTNITALEAVLTAVGSIGSAAGNGAIDTAVTYLEAQAGGGIWIDNTGGLTIGGITALVGVSAGGTIEISAASPIDVTEDVISTGGPITLTAGDTAAAGDDLTVYTTVTVRSDTSDVTLRAGDNLTLQDSSTVSASAGQVALLGDYGNADPGIGSAMNLLGTITSGAQATVTGGSDNDTINLNPGVGHTADSILLDGAGGDDVYFVQLGRLNGPVDINDSGVGGNDRASVSGTAAGEDFTVHNNDANGVNPQTGGFVTDNTIGETVNYSQTLEHLNVLGQDGQDTFHVQPSQTAEITINGGNPAWGYGMGDVPQVGDGDVLDFDPLGNTFTATCNTILTNGGNPDPFKVVTFAGIEKLPLKPLGTDTQHYDMDFPDDNPMTAPGYTSVLTTTVYGGGNTFGWDSPVNGASTTLADPLLKDEHIGTTPHTFTTDIADGFYLVAVTMGNGLQAFDNLVVQAEGQTVLPDVDVPFGQFVERSFVVQVKDGTLDLTFSDADAINPLWLVNSIDIRPGVILTLGIIPPAGPLVGDGTTVDNFGGVNATPNSQVTVMTDFGTIVSPDVNPLIAGIQVQADAMGHFNFDVQRPSTGGQALVKAEETDGAQTGCVLVDYLTPPESHFDFNSGGSPTAAGYTGVGDVNAYDATLGYGWQTTASTIDHTGPNALLQDGHFSTTDNTFIVNVNNGTYTVNVTLGDAVSATGPVDVYAEGVQMLNNISTPAGQFVSKSFQVTVSDGQLDVHLANDGGSFWELNALDVIVSPNPITITNLGGPVPADGTTVDAFNGSGAAPNSLVTVTTSFGTIVNADADPNYAGIQLLTDAGGNFTIDVRRPFVAGTADITAEQVNAASAGSTTQEYTGGAGLRIDLNSAGTPTAAGFVGLGPVNAYDPLLGFGWQTTAPTFSSVGPNDLLEDFHYGTTTNTFLVDLTAGDYLVNVTMGYQFAGFDNVDISAEGNPELTGLGSTAGQFIHRSFIVNVSDGQLDLQFTDTGGSSFFPVDAIEIYPSPPVPAPITITGPSNIEGDGTTIDAYNGTGATANSLVTISTDLGTIVSPDASAAYAGIQVMTDGSGNFSFNMQRASTAGTAHVSAEEVSGASQGTTTVIYTAPASLMFDFNSFGTPTAVGYTGVGTTNTFDPVAGYGWVSNSATFSVAGPDALLEDFHYGTGSNTFQVAVQANATYHVTASFRYIASVSGFNVSAEGNPELTGVNVPANTTVVGDFDVTDNGDGVLNIGFDVGSASFYLINALEITFLHPLVAAVAPLADSTAPTLTSDALAPIVNEAIARWSSLQPNAAAQLAGVQVQIADISGSDLGLAGGHQIVIDSNAAGYGWFVDPTPHDDSEFDASGNAIAAAAVGHFDLLTVVMHELGHLLGYDDLDPATAGDAVMNGSLPLSTRRGLLSTEAIDNVMAGTLSLNSAAVAGTSATLPPTSQGDSPSQNPGLISSAADEAMAALEAVAPIADNNAHDRFFADFGDI